MYIDCTIIYIIPNKIPIVNMKKNVYRNSKKRKETGEKAKLQKNHD